MDRPIYSYGEIQRRLGELEHQHEAGAIEWREYRAARAELLAMLHGDGASARTEREQIYSFQQAYAERAARYEADPLRRRAA
ncbi:MAG: hypothetical protein U0939_13065 [Pirellulales bacterium]